VFSDFLEAIEIGAIASVINAPPLVFEDKAAVAPLMVAQDARAPVFGRG